ncbi:hypothetical protein [Limosilactobacillus walteri]|uniref:Membrane protein 6-pyruvoyl-tetrahydropterin synthase-related domain-containing protein n=1 Tax=Limosilactobacillus walteri TaxID=2268022 RepID=A0ABR8P4V8_9LACO|nr:hypothetical protein [Limosilactobacillus walteri]MBD5805681.1 hypothetical protein [Limosilactobacillus walteri]
MSRLYKNCFYPVLLVINAILICFFLFKLKLIPLGWDTQFHLNRIEELYRSLKAGHLFSSTGTYAFSQIGLAINRFYPYLFLYLFAGLRFIFNPIFAYNTGIFLLALSSLFISYYSIKTITHSKKAAFIFSTLYNNSGYLLLQVSVRGDIAEYIALILLPLIFMGGVKTFDLTSFKWVWLPVGVVLVSYTHILSTIIFSFFILIIIIVEYKKFNLTVIKRLIISTFIALIICLPLVITMIHAQSRESVVVPVVPDVLINEALSPSSLINNSLNNLSPNTLLDVNLGFIILLAGIIGLLAFKTTDKRLKYIETIGLLCLILSTNLFPWFIFQRTPVHIIQFPWRLLGVATFCFALVFAKLAKQNTTKLDFWIWLFVCLISFTYMHQYAYNSKNNLSTNNLGYYEKIATNAVYTDYMPEKTMNGLDRTKAFRSHLSVHRHIAVINGRRVKLKDSNIKSKYNLIQYKLTGLKKNEKNKVILPVLNYGRNYSSKGNIVKVSSEGETEVKFVPTNDSQTINVYLR